MAGCGKKEPGIPRSDASELIKLLRTVQDRADDPQKCDSLKSTIDELQARVRDLPSKTDSDVRDSLRNGVRNLELSANEQCKAADTTPTTPTTPETVPTTPPETTPPETVPTTPPDTTPTTPPETTPPPTTPPVPTTPGTGGTGPGNGNGPGQGGNHFGNGNGKAHGHKPGKGPKK
jgi:hypothetical protein